MGGLVTRMVLKKFLAIYWVIICKIKKETGFPASPTAPLL